MLQNSVFNPGKPVIKPLAQHRLLCRTVVQIGTVQANCDICSAYLKWHLYNSAVKISLKALVNGLKYARHEKASVVPGELRQDLTLKKRKWKSLSLDSQCQIYQKKKKKREKVAKLGDCWQQQLFTCFQAVTNALKADVAEEHPLES